MAGGDGGGRKPGAGRKKNVPNKISREDRAKARASGILPLEITLDIMRKRYAKLERMRKTKGVSEAKLKEQEDATLAAADKASPFLHHKLQAIQHKVDPIDLNNLTLEELEELERLKLKLDQPRPGHTPGIH
jgi:hypothetical protein